MDEIVDQTKDQTDRVEGLLFEIQNGFDLSHPESEVELLCNVCNTTYATTTTTTTTSSSFVTFSQCNHTFCESCVKTYFKYSIENGKSSLSCLQCDEAVTESEVRLNLQLELYQRYLSLGLRHYLALQPNVRNCIAPDCPFLYLLDNPSDCTDNHFVCNNVHCGIEFCYQCKEPWHEGRTCSTKSKTEALGSGLTKEDLKSLNIKMCPRCGTAVEKVDDGACNHVQCSVCHLEFCWLCLRPSSEIHYLSPTGCPMYGQRRWSCCKRWLLRVSLWIAGPPLILLLSFLIFWVCLVAVPCLVGYLVYKVFVQKKKLVIQLAVLIFAVSTTIFLSPFVSLLLALIVIPLGLSYVYLFIPIHLIRTYYSNNEMAPYVHTV